MLKNIYIVLLSFAFILNAESQVADSLLKIEKFVNSKKNYKSEKFLYLEEEYGWAKKFFSQNKPKSSISVFERILLDYPTSKYESESLFMIGYLYNNSLKDTTNAKIYYKKIIEEYPKSEFSNSAKFELKHLAEPDFIPNFK